VVESIEDDSVYLHQDLRDTEGDWFYWYFSVIQAQGRTVRFNFTQSRCFTIHGPAFSTDNGKTWAWLGSNSVEGNSFTYTFGPTENSTLFCMSIPYVGADWDAFVKGNTVNSPLVEIGKLGFSHQRRPVETLWLGCLGQTVEHRVVLSARHHSCETMGSYALEGMVAFILSNDPEAIHLRQCTEFLIIPFVDKDGVELGDQGKNRHPHDHNRDYAQQNLYPETAALRNLLPTWSQGRLNVVLDFHCPWIADGVNEILYFVGSAHPRIWEQQQRFGEILERSLKGPLPYRASDNLPFGHGWNIPINFRMGRTFADWATDLPEVRLATTIEVPYANAGGGMVTRESARAFGADVGRALAAYL